MGFQINTTGSSFLQVNVLWSLWLAPWMTLWMVMKGCEDVGRFDASQRLSMDTVVLCNGCFIRTLTFKWNKSNMWRVGRDFDELKNILEYHTLPGWRAGFCCDNAVIQIYHHRCQPCETSARFLLLLCAAHISSYFHFTQGWMHIKRKHIYIYKSPCSR